MLINLGHTKTLLHLIAHDRKNTVQLDFFPDTTILEDPAISRNRSLGYAAFLYSIFPILQKQKAQLLVKGGAFRAYVRETTKIRGDNIMDLIERGLQNNRILTYFSYFKDPKADRKGVDTWSKNADFRKCRGGHVLLGCFYKKHRGHDVDHTTCNGCRMMGQMDEANELRRGEYFDGLVNEWVYRGGTETDESGAKKPVPVPIDELLESARRDLLVPLRADITMRARDKRREYEAELDRLVALGKIKPGQRWIPGKYNWARPRRH